MPGTKAYLRLDVMTLCEIPLKLLARVLEQDANDKCEKKASEFCESQKGCRPAVQAPVRQVAKTQRFC